MLVWVVVVLSLLGNSVANCIQNQQWTDDFAIEVNGEHSEEVKSYLKSHGFKLVRKVFSTEEVYHIQHKDVCHSTNLCKQSADEMVQLLRKHPHIKHVEQQVLLERDFRSLSIDSVINDEVNRRNRILDNLHKAVSEKLDKLSEDLSLSEKHANEDAEYSQEVKLRTKRTSNIDFNDPGWTRQWQLNNVGQYLEHNPGIDLNLVSAYRKDYRGQGGVVTIVDDGIDTRHPDIKPNYDPAASADLNDPKDVKGNPRSPLDHIPPTEAHGTSCAGLTAGIANNKICSVGVAHKANIGGIRILAGLVTDLLEAYALVHNNQYIDVYSNSWGPKDNAQVMEMPKKYTGKALKIGIKSGRNGKGSIYCFASGNGGSQNDSCGADGFSNSPYTISFTAINVRGRSPFYTEKCAALSVAIPVGGHQWKSDHNFDPQVTTSNVNEGCTNKFDGTSAATPMGAGCLVLALQANPNLTWRDVQHLLTVSARIPNREQLVWQRNGAGVPVSHVFGFGLLDCARLVMKAQTWVNVGKQHICEAGHMKEKSLPIYASRKTRIVFDTDACRDDPTTRVDRLEHVLVTLKLTHVLRGDLEVWLTSPHQTRSPLLTRRNLDRTKSGIDFTFLTRMNWNEQAIGKWVLEIIDHGSQGIGKRSTQPRGSITLAKLQLLGRLDNTTKVDLDHKSAHGGKEGRAHVMSRAEVEKEYHDRRKEFIQSSPEHRKTFELKQRLAGKNKTHIESDLKLIDDLHGIANDNNIDDVELDSVVKTLKSSNINVRNMMRKKEEESDRLTDEALRELKTLIKRKLVEREEDDGDDDDDDEN